MFNVQVLNLSETQYALRERYPQAVKAGTLAGVERAAEELADDVSAHTPVKTGKAAAFVGTFVDRKDPMTRGITYGGGTAWYMLFYLAGTQAHPIYAKGRRGSQRSKAIAKHDRRHGVTTDWQSVYSERPETAKWGQFRRGATQLPSAWGFAQAIPLYGKAFSKVMHPGVKGNSLLHKRLDATAEKLKGTIRVVLDQHIDEAKRNG